MLSRLFRKILFNLVHFILAVLQILCKVHEYVVTEWNSFQCNRQHLNDVQLIISSVPQLHKKPKHLVLIDDPPFSLAELASLVIWSLVAGIPYLTFYQRDGLSQDQEEKLFEEVERQKCGVPGCIKWSFKPDLNGYSNGLQPHIITINLVSQSDGAEKLSQMIRNMAESHNYVPTRSEYTAEELDAVIRLQYPAFPEPELVMYAGAVCCSKGLLPWHIRLSEFVHCSTCTGLRASKFLSVLRKYSKCDQRFGK